MNTRRTFLKLAGAAAGALGLAHYAEPFAAVPDAPPKHSDWIEDRGDFYVVRVPDFKTFANERLTKPTIFLLGTQAVLKNLQVESFANVHAPRGGFVHSSVFDVRRARIARNRALLELSDGCSNMTLTGCHFISDEVGSTAPLILVREPTSQKTPSYS